MFQISKQFCEIDFLELTPGEEGGGGGFGELINKYINCVSCSFHWGWRISPDL